MEEVDNPDESDALEEYRRFADKVERERSEREAAEEREYMRLFAAVIRIETGRVATYGECFDAHLRYKWEKIQRRFRTLRCPV